MAVSGPRILLIPFSGVPEYFLAPLRKQLERIFGIPVQLFSEITVPQNAFVPKRHQYLADAFLEKLVPFKQKPNDHLLGVTSEDLFSGKLNFVFGVASSATRTAVISTARLSPEFYGLPPDENLFQKRILKEAVHELGHTFGLPHCPNPRCVMHFSNSILDTDKKGALFCPNCLQKLKPTLR